jgi:hypothetical protein
MFDHILNWKLLEGSHDFPGPDGGTCINEAAIVAAGFKYRRIGDADECPKCFSPPIAAYALGLNDDMPDNARQGLLPFVMRLAGTADRRAIEQKRIEFIWVETMHRIIGPLAKRARCLYSGLWEYCIEAKDLEDVSRVGRSMMIVDGNLRLAAAYAAGCVGDTWEDRVERMYYAADCAQSCAESVRAIPRRKVWNAALTILDEAIMLGKHKVIEPELAIPRLEAAKRSRVDA